MMIDNIEVCRPITELVNLLSDIGCDIAEKKVNDYHFHEVFIEIKGGGGFNYDSINVKGVIKGKDNTFYCECHWSCVKLKI